MLLLKIIFCFFAEDTDIFRGENLFTSTIDKMSDSRPGNADFVIGELFLTIQTSYLEEAARSAEKLER